MATIRTSFLSKPPSSDLHFIPRISSLSCHGPFLPSFVTSPKPAYFSTKLETSKNPLFITKATAAPWTNEAPNDGRVQKVHSIEEFEEALKKAKNKLVMVQFAASNGSRSRKIYPVMVELSRNWNDVEFILVMGDESEKTRALCKREKVKKAPHFSFYKSMKKIYQVSPKAMRKSMKEKESGQIC